MKVLLDTSVVNWLADHPAEAWVFFAARDRGDIEVLVPLEVAAEIRRTNEQRRLDQLERVLRQFFPITPTRVPRLGAFRLATGRVATPSDLNRLEALGILKGGRDRLIATNAGGYRCDVFLTCDTEMSRDRRSEVEAILKGVRVLEPEVFLVEMRLSPRQ